ncbi:hypothetical protein [Synechococcus sp. HK01-R]|uniref:hypothetical protein n=1 Tax=Synechococcus sp. HK01-R TaxID=2751171 RepID=UPI001629B6E8|nr:hypothetical protein [Synechococcus sp. HK01-R]QNG27756.1 hypothetical protein H0O21_03985 [Synechococcus sp. HK01-R]
MSDASAATLRLRVAIPHFFREVEGGSGYGSGRPGQRMARSLALARCLCSLLALRRSRSDAVLHIGDRCIEHWPAQGDRLQRFTALEPEIHLFSDGTHQLNDVLGLFADRIESHTVALDNPRHLPLAARDWLIQSADGADLLLYLEDDLVISDPLFIDKQFWFLERTQHQLVLMPHRIEPTTQAAEARLLVDGPLRPEFLQQFCTPQEQVLRGRFDPDAAEVSFDISSNPHAGCFLISNQQARILQGRTLPQDGFVGPLETAATLTVLAHFPVLKASRLHQRFLQIEHGHPSFLSYLNTFPHR